MRGEEIMSAPTRRQSSRILQQIKPAKPGSTTLTTAESNLRRVKKTATTKPSSSQPQKRRMTNSKLDREQLVVPNAAAWRTWLDEHESTSDGVWLVVAKKGVTTPTSLTRVEAVEEALCSGWVDGQTKSIDDDVYIRGFTPRRKASAWSAINVDHVTRLRAEGRMRERGEEEVRKAQADGRWPT